MGKADTARERAAGGLNPVAGMDMSLEEAEELEAKLKQHKKDNKKKSAADGRYGELGGNQGATAWVPHRPERPAKSEGGVPINLASEYEPKGDQPTAIAELVEGVTGGEQTQVLLGVTGSGKTYTMARSSSAPSARR
jgi:excinuclease ABC subunit B